MKLLKNPLIDHSDAIEYIFTYRFNFTIVWPMGLTNKPFTEEYREAEAGVPEKSSTIPRPDVAHFILKAVNDTQYDNASIGIAS